MFTDGCKFTFVSSIFLVLFNYCLISDAVVTIQPLNIEVFAGENAVFECNTVIGLLSSTSKWQWFIGTDGHLIANEDAFVTDGYDVMISGNRTTSILTILNTTIIRNNGRVYSCLFGSSSPQATLTVIDGMRLDSMYPQCDSDMTSINTEKTAQLTCSAKGGDPKPELQWYRNGVNLSENQDFESYDSSSSYFEQLTLVLTIDDEDTVFMCKAEGLAADENQACQVQLRVPPDVEVMSNKTYFTSGESLEFTCIAMTPWKIMEYIWTINDEIMSTSKYTFILTNNMTTLVIDDFDADAEVKCEVITATGLTGSDSVTITFLTVNDESNWLLLAIILVGGAMLLLLVFIIVFIFAKRRQKQGKTSITKTERATFRNDMTDGIVHIVPVPLDNPNFIDERDYEVDIDNPNVLRINFEDNMEGYNMDDNHMDDDYMNDDHIDGSSDINDGGRSYEEKPGFETYANAESVASLGSFCSFNSFDHVDNRHSRYVGHMIDTGSQDRLTEFDDLYAKPNQSRQSKVDTKSVDGIDRPNVEELYTKPNKKYRQSIHQSLEDILKPSTDNNRAESFDDLYAKPNKKRATGQPILFNELYTKHDFKPKPPPKPRPIKISVCDDQMSSSNVIEHDFTYSSIA
ncbi:uncharacterized protein [Antedon mediterranea]|uniref:uncharacterized protein n=1 Tax=Antedon mediterranea TaxID=105859 RepID=UPI003AF480A5